MRTAKEYRESLYRMRPNLRIHGDKARRDDPRLQPALDLIATSYDLAHQPETNELFSATSILTGNKISRFARLYYTQEDLIKKLEAVRFLTRKIGYCAMRCGGVDTLNGFFVYTHEIDQSLGTEYHTRFKKWLQWYQENDLCHPILMTDPKGDRSLRPHQQADPDQYLRIVEKKTDGIVVNGCKFFGNTFQYDWLLVGPTRALNENDKDYAVAFAAPADEQGVTIVVKPIPAPSRKHLKAPYADEHGIAGDTMTIFNNVFIPWERVFLCGEWQFGGRLTHLQALNHRFSYCGCKPAVIDVVMGASSLAAEYNNLSNVSHIREKLSHLVATAELIYACGIAAAHTAELSSSGALIPNIVYSNVGRYHAGMTIYSVLETMSDIAGGLGVLVPNEEDFLHPEIGPLVQKYLKRKADVPVENIWRLWRLISEILFSIQGGWMMGADIHGGGSPIMEKLTILAQYNLDDRKNLVKRLAGIG